MIDQLQDSVLSVRPGPDGGPAVDGLAMFYLLVDEAGAVRWANESALHLLGRVAGGGGRVVTDLAHTADREGVTTMVRDTLAGLGPVDGVVRLAAPEDERYAHLLLSRRQADVVVVQGWDVSALVQRIRLLERYAFRDPLTGLANRITFMDGLRREIARSARGGTWIAVLFGDVDGLKAVNDSYGHEAGDRVLVGVGRRLAESLRPEDTLARMGGDEFAAVCPDLDDPGQAMSVADRLREAAAVPIAVDGDLVSVTLSVGVAFSSGAQGDEAASLLRRADEAMHDLKLRR